MFLTYLPLCSTPYLFAIAVISLTVGIALMALFWHWYFSAVEKGVRDGECMGS